MYFQLGYTYAITFYDTSGLLSEQLGLCIARVKKWFVDGKFKRLGRASICRAKRCPFITGPLNTSAPSLVVTCTFSALFNGSDRAFM